MLSCEMDVRAGGGYRVTFGRDEAHSRAFFGKYLEVSPPSRLVWTNDEGGEGAVTTVTFEALDDGRTLLVLSELYPSRAALDESDGAMDAMPEQFEQLDALLATFVSG
ncbi:MAG: SRPBCC domain-containing protein [Caulobacteraceae bacterium]